MAAPGLCSCSWALSSGQWGLLSSWGSWASHCGSFSCCGAQTLCAWVVASHRLSCSKACGIFLDHGSNGCPLYWQAESYPLDHQGSPEWLFKSPVLLISLIWKCFVHTKKEKFPGTELLLRSESSGTIAST